MTAHCDDQLVGLLSGELDGDQTRQVVAHLRDCGDCTSELIALAAAHGALEALRRSTRTTPAVVSEPVAAPLAPLVLPAPRRWLGAVAAALVLVAGSLTVGVALTRAHHGGGPAVANVAMRALDAPHSASGQVVVADAAQALQMNVSTTGLPTAPANHYYEVWLLQPATNKMLPVGLLSPSGKAQFQVAKTIMAQYSAVDISLQANNGDATHSKVSVLRGTVLAA